MEKLPSLKILYGVQATGQGHITRARSLGPALKEMGAEVDFLFSGRPRDKLFDMEEFGDFSVRRGLTFEFNNGKVNPFKTFMKNNVWTWVRDVASLDLKKYDVVVTDYEPVTAWAAKLRGKPSIGVGHQYAFQHDIPMKGFNALTLAAMRHFAPAKIPLGVHWDSFGHSIIPPIIPLLEASKQTIDNKIVVYLYFEDQEKLAKILAQFPAYDFYIYAPTTKHSYDEGHLKYRPTSKQFREDIENCAGIICGAGFELPSEAIHMGKKLLVKPMQGQPEQHSNAHAIEELDLGHVMYQLNAESVAKFLSSETKRHISFPDTARDVAQWILEREWSNTNALVSGLWQKSIER